MEFELGTIIQRAPDEVFAFLRDLDRLPWAAPALQPYHPAHVSAADRGATGEHQGGTGRPGGLPRSNGWDVTLEGKQEQP